MSWVSLYQSVLAINLFLITNYIILLHQLSVSLHLKLYYRNAVSMVTTRSRINVLRLELLSSLCMSLTSSFKFKEMKNNQFGIQIKKGWKDRITSVATITIHNNDCRKKWYFFMHCLFITKQPESASKLDIKNITDDSFVNDFQTNCRKINYHYPDFYHFINKCKEPSCKDSDNIWFFSLKKLKLGASSLSQTNWKINSNNSFCMHNNNIYIGRKYCKTHTRAQVCYKYHKSRLEPSLTSRFCWNRYFDQIYLIPSPNQQCCRNHNQSHNSSIWLVSFRSGKLLTNEMFRNGDWFYTV